MLPVFREKLGTDGVSSMRTLALIPKHNTNASGWMYGCDLFLFFVLGFFFLERKYNTPLEVYMKRHIEYILIVDASEAREKEKGRGFRRRRILCLSEASNRAPSLASLPPPWVWSRK